MKIDRVILASDDNKNYIEFWPIVAKAWAHFGVKPTLIYTGKDDDFIDSEVGEVIRIPKIANLSSAFLAQNLRLLIPSLFPSEVSIISDIDNLPMNKSFFFNPIRKYEKDKFVSYRSDCADPDQLSMMWNVASGETWKEMFSVSSMSEIYEKVISWYSTEYRAYDGINLPVKSWFTDQIVLRKFFESFKQRSPDRVVELIDTDTGFFRLDRLQNDSKHTTEYNSFNYYSDYHMPRPYSKNKEKIDKIFRSHILRDNL